MSNQLCQLEPDCAIFLCSEIACLVPKLRAKTEKRVLWERNLAIGCDLGTHAFFAFLPNDSNAAQNFRCHILHSRPSDWELWQKNLQKLQNLAWMWMTIHRHLGWEPCYCIAKQFKHARKMLLQRGEQPLAYTWQPRRLAQLKVHRNFYCSRPGYGQYSRRIRRLG